jgi:hypothetical protein
MLNKIIIFFVLVIGGMLGLHYALQNGSLLRYLDAHPYPKTVPAVEYYLGRGYYLFQDTDHATVYYHRVVETYPKSVYADDAYFGFVQCLEDSPGASRVTLIDEYQKYLEQFPAGNHISVAKNRMDGYRTGG